MNPNHNGDLSPAGTKEDATGLLDHQEHLDKPESASGAPESTPTQTWATRADALKTTTMNRKPIVLLGGGLVAAIALFAVTTFVGRTTQKKASPSSQNNAQSTVSTKSKGSVTPIMDTVRNSSASDTSGQLTAADISRTKASTGSQPAPIPAQPSSRATSASGATLASVPPFESTQQHWEEPKPYGDTQTAAQSATTAQQQNLLKEASLVFVKTSEQAGSNATSTVSGGDDTAPELNLTPGTRLQARLETQVSNAVTAPVVAVVEYTYSLGEHVVIPAGARVYGQLQEADRSGAVSIKFNEIELLDGNREKIEAIGTSLEMGPIKGSVSGSNTGRNFLVRTASGIGSVAAMLVGNNTSGAFSEEDLIRERIGQNVGNAGDTEIMNMAVTNHIVISVPADTPIFIVFTKRDTASASSHRTTNAYSREH